MAAFQSQSGPNSDNHTCFGSLAYLRHISTLGPGHSSEPGQIQAHLCLCLPDTVSPDLPGPREDERPDSARGAKSVR